MKTVALGTLTSATAAASQKPEDSNAEFQRGGNILAVIQPTNGAFVGTAKIQGTKPLQGWAAGATGCGAGFSGR